MSGIAATRKPVNEDITRFVTETDRYYALTLSGRRINIVRSKSWQPSIHNEDDFKTYLWIEATDGFFICSQRIRKGQMEVWMVEEEIIPEKREHFFFEYFDELVAAQPQE